MDLSTPPADITPDPAPLRGAGPDRVTDGEDAAVEERAVHDAAVEERAVHDPSPIPRHSDEAPPVPRRRWRRGRGNGRMRTALRVLSVVVLVLLVPLGWSYGHALTRPGNESVGIRTTEWLRDHGGRGVVAWAENAWYNHHKPKKGGLPAASALPTVTSPPSTPPTTEVPRDVPRDVRVIAAPALPGEGKWQPTGKRALDGSPFLYTTFMRPDPVHTSLVTGLAWMDPKYVKFDLYSGYQEPGGRGWSLTAPIPMAARGGLIAAFNSGFKLADSRGGYMAEGRVAPGHPLVPGRAALIVYANGNATVGVWGRDATDATPNVRAVRENLQLLIDGGKEAPNLDVNSLATWGWTVKNKTLVWRSGVGVDAKGHLIYAAGNGLSVHSLADVLLAAGCVRAMELDINSEWTSFLSYSSDATVPGGSVGTKLIPDMRTSPNRYFISSDRDFFTVFER